MESKIIVALDRMDLSQATALGRKIKGHVAGFKFRVPMLLRHSIWAIHDLKHFGKVMLDTKGWDIESSMAEDDIPTYSKAGVDLVTLHASADTRRLAACVKACQGTETRLLAVTVLTDTTEEECLALYGKPRKEAVPMLWGFARDAGVHGMVCGLPDIQLVDPKPELIVCPGFRPPGTNTNEQKATGGYEEAKQASFVVIGRPITEAEDPLKVVEEFNKGLAG